MSKMSGHCLCGAVKLTAEVPSTEHGVCHCGMCRRWSGGAGFFAIGVEGAKIEGEENVSRYDSSDWAQRCFCKKCGTHLYYFLKPRQSYLMAVGVFDDQSPFRLNQQIFIDRKPEGYAYAGEHKFMTEAEMFAHFAPKP